MAYEDSWNVTHVGATQNSGPQRSAGYRAHKTVVGATLNDSFLDCSNCLRRVPRSYTTEEFIRRLAMLKWKPGAVPVLLCYPEQLQPKVCWTPGHSNDSDCSSTSNKNQ